MEIENEENVLVCLKIFMELHKQYRPNYCTEVDVSIVTLWERGGTVLLDGTWRYLAFIIVASMIENEESRSIF